MRKYVLMILAVSMMLCVLNGCAVTGEYSNISEQNNINPVDILDQDVQEELDTISDEEYFNGFYAEENIFYGADTVPWMYSYELLDGEFVPGGTIELRITRLYVGDEPCTWKAVFGCDLPVVGWHDCCSYSYEDYPYPNASEWYQFYLDSFAYLYFYKDGTRQPENHKGFYGYYAYTDEASEWRSASVTSPEFDDLVIQYGDMFVSDMHITIPDDVEFDEVWLLANSGRDISYGLFAPREDRTVTLGIIYSKSSPDCEDDEVVDTTVVDENCELNRD